MAIIELITLGYLVGQYIYHRLNEEDESGSGERIHIPKTEEGSTVPLVFGRVRVRNPVVAWHGNTSDEDDPTDPDTFGRLYSIDVMWAVGIPFLNGDVSLTGIWFADKESTAFPPFPFVNNAAGPFYAIGTPSSIPQYTPHWVTCASVQFSDGGDTVDVGNDGGFFQVSMAEAGVSLDEVPGYRGYATLFLRDLQMKRTSLPEINFELASYPQYPSSPYYVSAIAPRIGDDANPADVIAALLCDRFGKQGQETTILDANSFRRSGETLLSEEHGFSMCWDRRTETREMINQVLKQTDGVLYKVESTGKWHYDLIRGDYSPTELGNRELNPTNCEVDPGSFAAGGWTDTVNKIRVIFTDRNDGYRDNSATAQNQANAVGQDGEVVELVMRMPGITNHELAAKVAARELSARSRPIMKVKVIADRSFEDFVQGQPVQWSWPELNVSQRIMRVGNISKGSADSNHVEMELIEDFFYVYRRRVGFDPGDVSPFPGSPPFETIASIPAFEYPDGDDFTSAINVGGEAEIFKEEVGNELRFRTVTGTGGIVITEGTDTIEIDGSGITGGGGGETNTASNVGGGAGVFKQKTGVDLELRSLTASGRVSVTENTSTISVATTAEANTASNVGSGAQVFKAKTSEDLAFRSIVQGSNVTITQNTNDITIDAAAPGETNTGSNVGSGAQVFKTKTGVDFVHRTLSSGTGVTVTQNTNDIGFSTTAEANTASNVGGEKEVFKTKTGVDLVFRTLKAGTNITLTQNTNDVTIAGAATPSAPGLVLGFFGDGSDGDQVLDGATTILGMAPSSNIYIAVRDLYFNNLTIDASVFLEPRGFRIFVKNLLTINGIIRRNGNAAPATTGGIGTAAATGTAHLGTGSNGGAGAASGGGGAAGGTGGTSTAAPFGATAGATAARAAPTAGGSGVAGANGGIMQGGSGGSAGWTGGTGVGSGAGGTVTIKAATQGALNSIDNALVGKDILRTTSFTCGTGGGGGGHVAGGGNSGGGGGGAGYVVVCARDWTGSGSIQAIGGAGGSTVASGGIGGGGGGGGAGGIVVYVGGTGTSPTISVAGGAGGAGSSGASGVAGAGGDGGSGLTYIFV